MLTTKSSFFTINKKILLVLWIAVTCVFQATYLSAAEDRLERIKQRGEVRVCIWPDYYAISYRNPLTSKLEGIDIDMAKAFAKSLGVNVAFIDSSFALLAQNLSKDKCDIAMHGVGVTASREEYLDFSVPHLSSGIYAVAAKSSTYLKEWRDIDQAGNIVVVHKGTYMEPVMREYLQQAELKVVNRFLEREQEVKSGRADVFMADYPYSKRVVEVSGWGKVLAPEVALAPTSYAYAVAKEQPEFLAVVNAFVIEQKANGSLLAFAKKHQLEKIVAN